MKKLIILSIMSACLMSFAQTNTNAQITAQVKKAIIGFNHAPTGQKIWIVETNKLPAAQQELLRQEQVKKELNNLVTEKMNGIKDGDKKKIDFGWQPEVSALTSALSGIMNEASVSFGEGCTAASLGVLVQNAPIQLTNDLMIEMSQLSDATQACLRK